MSATNRRTDPPFGGPVRKPHAAGSFYPAGAAEIHRFVKPLLPSSGLPLKAKAVILPHAGYLYSGQTACKVISRIQIPDRNLLIGPDHRGAGGAFSIYPEGVWETPVGRTQVDEDLVRDLMRACPDFEADAAAHAYEHSLEVLVPLLQIKNPNCRIAPVLAGTTDLDLAREAAVAAAGMLAAKQSPPLLVISNDMSHYENDAVTRKKDRYALDAIEQLDAGALAKAVREHSITMCGFIPVYMLLVMSRALGIQKSVLLDYRTSADATGDRERVVGYAGFVFS